MGLLNTIRQFLKPLIKSPITAGIVSYLIFKLLSKHTSKKESLSESIRVVKRHGDKELIFDTKSGTFAVVKSDGTFEPYTSKQAGLKALMEKKLRFKEQEEDTKMMVTYRQKLSELYDSINK